MFLTSAQLEAWDKLDEENEEDEEDYEMYGDGSSLWKRNGITPQH